MSLFLSHVRGLVNVNRQAARLIVAGGLFMVGTGCIVPPDDGGDQDGTGSPTPPPQYSAEVANGELRIVGTEEGAALALRLQAGVPTVLEVDVGDDGSADFSFDRDEFDRIVIDAGGGDDSIRIDETNGIFTDTEITTINGGNGNDSLIGGSGAETFSGGDGDDTVDGNQGNDTAFLGAGNDTFVWDPGDGSDVVEGQDGSDVMDFNGSGAAENIDVSANGARLRFFRNIGNITMDVDGVEQVTFNALGGADNVVVNDLAGTAVTQVSVDLAGVPGGGAGDGQADAVIVNGTPAADTINVSADVGAVVVDGLAVQVRIDGREPNLDRLVVNGVGGDLVNVNGSDAADTMSALPSPEAGHVRVIVADFSAAVDVIGVQKLSVNGLGGPDTISGTGNLAGLAIPLQFDGGEGNDTINGSNGIDVLLGGEGDDVVDGNQGNDAAFLGAGNDVFVWAPGDGSDVVEGQDGADVMDFNGSGAAENIDVSANGARLRFFRNVGNITMDVNGVEQVTFNALGGADNVVVNDLAGTAVTRVSVDLAGVLGGDAGDGQPDTVIVNGTAGADTINVSADAGAVVVDGLAAQVRIEGREPNLDRLVVNGVGGDLVNVNGSEAADTMNVLPSPEAGHVRVMVADFSAAVDVIGVQKLSVNGLGGPDTISGTGNLAGVGIPLQFDGGEGNDTVEGSNGIDVLLGGDGDDVVDGNQGNDTAFLGAGNDTFVWDPGDGSDVVEGQDGSDVMDFNGSGAAENIDVSANGARLRFFRNIGNITMDVDGVEQVTFNALGGADNVVVNDLAGTAVTQVSVDLAGVLGGGAGDGQVDAVIVNGTAGADTINVSADAGAVVVAGLAAQVRIEGREPNLDRLVVNGVGGDLVNVNGSEAADTMSVLPSPEAGHVRVIVADFSAAVDVIGVQKLSVNGLGGPDTISGTGNLAGVAIPLQFDGGEGNDTVEGSNGIDVLLGGDGDDVVDGNQGNDTAFLGAGNDVFVWDPGDGSDVVEGQDGADVMDFNGSAAAENIDVSANGARLRFLRNVGNIRMDVDGVEQVTFNALGGTDNVVVNDLAGTAVTQVKVELAGVLGGNAGDGARDVVTVNGTAAADTINVSADAGAVVVDGLAAQVRVTHSEAANDQLIVNGLGGVDTITPGPGLAGLIILTINQD